MMDGTRDDQMVFICDSPDCSCEDICCQTCDKAADCEQRCGNAIIISNLYSDYGFLAQFLEGEAQRHDMGAFAMAAQAIRKLSKQVRVLDEALRLACTDLYRFVSDADDIPCEFCPVYVCEAEPSSNECPGLISSHFFVRSQGADEKAGEDNG